MVRSRQHYRHVLFAVAFASIVASTGVAFTVEARTTRTPWIAAASALDENATESTGLFLAGASLIGLAATVRKLSNSRAGLLPKMRIDEMAADER